jgi:hypothetical protein
VLPRDEPVPSSRRITLDDVITSTTSGFPPLVSLTTSPNSDNQHVHTRTHINPNQSLNQSEKGKGTQKRKASEALHPPEPPKSPKVQKTGKDNNTGGPGAAQTEGQSKKRRGKSKRERERRRRHKQNSRPEPSNLSREEGKVKGEDDGNIGYVYEEGEIQGGHGSGDEPDYDPANPYGVDHTWGQSGTTNDTHDP